MRVLDKTTEPELQRSDNCKYMVCVGGYPRATMPTFAEAAARARDLTWFEPDDDLSIYEVETGIHFDIHAAIAETRRSSSDSLSNSGFRLTERTLWIGSWAAPYGFGASSSTDRRRYGQVRRCFD